MSSHLRRTIFATAFLFLSAFCFHSTMIGQGNSSTKGGLAGVIADESGAVIPQAKVTVSGQADTRTATTNDDGRFEVGDLTPGLYTVTVEREGFSSTSAKNIEVAIGRNISVNLTMKPGASAETVEVDATAANIDTSATAISTNLSDSFYNSVPVARNVGSLFYTAPGVTNGGGSGSANPSIGGATGLENQYIADGVNITDAGYGGLGVFSPIYGSLGTGINLTFIQEVQVKTGAFEPKYGKANGGVVQIVTKSGGTQYHGALSAYFAPSGFAAGQRYADDYFNRVNVRGRIFEIPQYDGAIEIGGYVPGNYLKNHLFFYGAYNPALNQVGWISPSVAPLSAHGPFTNNTTVNSWAAKLTYKLNDNTSVDASAFGDPSKTNLGFGAANEDTFPLYPNLNLAGTTGFSLWNYGTRSETLHITTAPNPTWLVDLAASAKTSHFTESPSENVYNIIDNTGIIQAGQYTPQGLGFLQNPNTDQYDFGLDGQKTVVKFGQHVLSLGYGYDHSIYKLTKAYTGPYFNFPSANIAGTPLVGSTAATSLVNNPALVGASTNAAFFLQTISDGSCDPSRCPYLTGPNGTEQVYLNQVRGIFSPPTAATSAVYQAIYGNDAWTLGPRVTLNLGLRWDEEQLNGITQAYVFNDNWSPRLGISVDPKGDRRTKIFFNWGRYTQQMPQDAALRDLSNELDINRANWRPESDANNNAIIGPSGTVIPVLDAEHLLNGDPLSGSTVGKSVSTSGGASSIFIAPGTKLNFEEEYVAGIERQMKGFVLSARYTDRRLLRVLEDASGASPEGGGSGFVPQNFVIGNMNTSTDLFVNEQEQAYSTTPPADCPTDYGIQSNSLGQPIGGACGFNVFDANGDNLAGLPVPDGKADGFANPYRHYQAFEIEANKNFSHNWMLRVNYRWAKLYGNYEGLFRNDNGQSDPSISSLFDFTQGVLGMLGDQFVQGFLNTDRRQVGNLYGSYVFPRGMARNLQLGLGFRGESGAPISQLAAHPVYFDAGEVPLGGRGTVGRTASNYGLDLHSSYPVPVGEKFKLILTFDAFNVTNSRSLTSVDQDIDLGFGSPNEDYLKPLEFQRAFYGRGSIKLQF